MSNCYAVETTYDYEGSTLQLVTTSKREAFKRADEIEMGDVIEVSRWLDGECVETWRRLRGSPGYARRIVVKGEWKEVAA
jgi:hypothetical protein